MGLESWFSYLQECWGYINFKYNFECGWFKYCVFILPDNGDWITYDRVWSVLLERVNFWLLHDLFCTIWFFIRTCKQHFFFLLAVSNSLWFWCPAVRVHQKGEPDGSCPRFVSIEWLTSAVQWILAGFWHILTYGRFSGHPWGLLRQKLGRVWKSSIFLWEARWDLKGFLLPSTCCKEEGCYLVCTLSPTDRIIESNLPFLLPDIAYGEDCWSEDPDTNRYKYMKAYLHLSKVEQVPTLRGGI